MNLSSVLGKHLKSNDVLEILERFDLQVVYVHDWDYENESDYYWAAARPQGFAMRFNAAQELEAILCYVTASEGFTPDLSITGKVTASEGFTPIDPSIINEATASEGFTSIDPSIIGESIFENFSDAEAYCQRTGTPYQASPATQSRSWLLTLLPSRTAQYSFEDGQLILVTLTLPP